MFVVPFLKYPANPPGANAGDTVGQRTGLYLVMVLFWMILAIGAVALRYRFIARLGAWNATLLATGTYLVGVGAVEFLMPAMSETPAAFPATVLYQFRLASFGAQLVVWVTLELVFGALVERDVRRERTARAVQAPSGG